ncbi:MULTISPECIES: SH3 domain-containing protein [unclassified Marinovum]
MKTYIWLTFAFLGWGYYEASGGADFQPGNANAASNEVVAEASEIRPAAPARIALASDRSTRPGSTEHQLEAALLVALRNSSSDAIQPQTLSNAGNIQTVAFRAESDTVAKTPRGPRHIRVSAEVDAPSEDMFAAVTESAPEATPRPRLRPANLETAQATTVVPTISTSGLVEDQTMTKVVSRANLRLGPGTNFPVLDTLSGGSEVRVLRRTNDGWIKLKSSENGRIGWMADFLVAAR